MYKVIRSFSSFSVKDQNEAKQFYTEVLGLKTAEDKMGLRLILNDNQEVFVYQKENHVPATFTVLNFVVSNVEEIVSELVSKGVVFEKYDMPDFKTDEKGIARGKAQGKGPDIAWFKDPSGNIFSVMQTQ